MIRCYEAKKLGPASIGVINQANTILREYSTITLRGLYYQFIARDLFPDSWIDVEYNRKNGLHADTKNTEKNYKRLGVLIGDARMAGLLDWNTLIDSGRSSSVIDGWEDPAEIIESSLTGFYINKWEDQPAHVEVMVEKDAMAPTIRPICSRLSVGFSANKGYSSLSHFYRVGQRIRERIDAGKRCVILYLGDHDPSGLDMSRDVEDRIRLFASEDEDYGGYPPSEGEFEVKRLALNMPQVEAYNPPPNPARVTDSRFRKYQMEFGDESWELDALAPSVIDTLITREVDALRDANLWQESTDRENGMKAELREFVTAWRNR